MGAGGGGGVTSWAWGKGQKQKGKGASNWSGQALTGVVRSPLGSPGEGLELLLPAHPEQRLRGQGVAKAGDAGAADTCISQTLVHQANCVQSTGGHLAAGEGIRHGFGAQVQICGGQGGQRQPLPPSAHQVLGCPDLRPRRCPPFPPALGLGDLLFPLSTGRRLQGPQVAVRGARSSFAGTELRAPGLCGWSWLEEDLVGGPGAGVWTGSAGSRELGDLSYQVSRRPLQMVAA